MYWCCHHRITIITVVDDRFYMALFSALEQTHCALDVFST